MEVYRTIDGHIRVFDHTIVEYCVCFAIKFRSACTTFDAHIYAELVDIYILAGQICRKSIDSEDCVLYSELA